MKKFTFHIDMIIVVVMLFVLCIAGNLYQRKIHLDLHKENIALIKELTDTKVELNNTRALLKKL